MDGLLGQSIARHYISGTLFRAGWVVGSLEMIGSPAGLTRAVSTGMRDFVALPYNGILNGPWAFLRGWFRFSKCWLRISCDGCKNMFIGYQ